jgi:hypothetical protein
VYTLPINRRSLFCTRFFYLNTGRYGIKSVHDSVHDSFGNKWELTSFLEYLDFLGYRFGACTRFEKSNRVLNRDRWSCLNSTG